MRLGTIAAMVTLGAISGGAVSVTVADAAPAIQPATSIRGYLVREIDDPSTGGRWLLLRDETKPGGPGRLVLVAGPKASSVMGLAATTLKTNASEETVIRTGDALIVEQHSPIIDARFQAVALSSAAPGNAFRARLTIGGEVVRVVAIASGRAVFASWSEADR